MANMLLNSKTIMLPVDMLKVDPSYQRDTNNPKSQALIKRIAEHFNENAFGAITVTKRADGYYIVDGQHRVEGAKLAGRKMVLCIVATNLNISREAETYKIINGDRKNQTYAEMFKAKLQSGDQEALDIKNITERFDFQIMKSGHKNYIKCIKELEIIYRQLGRANFTRLFYLLRHTWGGERFSLLKEFLLGMMFFIEKAGDKFTDAEFIKKMNRIAPIDIIKSAKLYLLTSSDRYAYAKAILKFYNHNRNINKIPEKIFYTEETK